MEFEFHPEAIEEFSELPEEDIQKVRESIDSRKNRENSILDQRGTGISYDNHGEPVHYFKSCESYRVFFEIEGNKVIILGIRPRNDDTYLNLREYTRRTDRA